MLDTLFRRSLTVAVLAFPSIGLAQVAPDYTERDFATAYGDVHIEWDTHGVPEVAGLTDSAAFFGWGYAMSVDRFFQMEVARRVLRGTTAELLSETLPDAGTKNDPVELDTMARKLRYAAFAAMSEVDLRIAHTEQMDLIDAFSAGVNQYLLEKLGATSTWAANPAKFRDDLITIDELFEKNPLNPEHFALWTAQDTILAQWRISNSPTTNLSGEIALRLQYDSLIGDPGISHEEALFEVLGSPTVDEDSMTVLESDVPSAHKDALANYAVTHGWGTSAYTSSPFVVTPGTPHPKFSHSFAVGGNRTTTGRGALLGMPQLGASKMLFEISVKGPTFTSRGICFAGVPGYLVGFNDHVAWSVTGAGGTANAVLQLTAPTPQSYLVGDIAYPVIDIPDSVNFRVDGYDPNGTAPPIWSSRAIIVSWAPKVTHDNQSDPLGEQTTRRGVPILTADQVAPPAGKQIALLTPRYFDLTRESVISYIDMLRTTNVAEFDQAMDLYATPALTTLAADKDGDTGYWFAKPVLLHTSDTSIAPLGSIGMQDFYDRGDLPSDLIPMEFMPKVFNPLNQTTPGVRSNLEGIILTGNNGAVGSWYPIPTYSGTGDTMRSHRFRQLLSAKGPDIAWQPEELFGFHYDDVDPFKFAAIKAALYQEENFPNSLCVEARSFLARLVDPQFDNTQGQDWVESGGHMHSDHPLMAIIGYVGTDYRTPNYPVLTRLYGSSQAGFAQFYASLQGAIDQNQNLLTYHSESAANAEVKRLLDRLIGNAEVRAVNGHGSLDNAGPVYTKYTGPANTWKSQYLGRTFNGPGKKTSGARFLAQFHAEFTPYGSLDPDKDITTGVLHNPRYGVGPQAFTFYSQWVHFRWHDPAQMIGSPVNAQAIFAPGNSLHMSSPYWANATDLWERDGLLFDLTSTQADPTRYVRPAPLQ